jgi:hypothetical protein
MAHIESLQSVGAIYQVSIKVAEHRVSAHFSLIFFSQTWVFQNPTVFIHKFSTRKSPEIRHSPFQLDPRQLGQPWIGTWIRTIFVCNIKLTLIGTYIYMYIYMIYIYDIYIIYIYIFVPYIYIYISNYKIIEVEHTRKYFKNPLIIQWTRLAAARTNGTLCHTAPVAAVALLEIQMIKTC